MGQNHICNGVICPLVFGGFIYRAEFLLVALARASICKPFAVLNSRR